MSASSLAGQLLRHALVRRGQLGLEVRQPLGPRLARAVQRGLQRGLARRELLETTEGCSSKLRCTLAKTRDFLVENHVF